MLGNDLNPSESPMGAEWPIMASPMGHAAWGDVAHTFLAARAATTVTAYAADLGHWQHYVGASSPLEAVAALLGHGPGLAHQKILAWIGSMEGGGLAPATINRRLAALRTLAKVARLTGVITWTIEIAKRPSVPYRDTRGPGRDGYETLVAIAAEQSDERLRTRDLAILRLMWRGLRVSEIVSLDVEHLELAQQRISILGKHRREREWVTIPPTAIAAVDAWLAIRDPHVGPLFCRLDRGAAAKAPGDRRLTTEGVRRMLNSLAAAAHLPHVHPHGLRHAAITAALDHTHGDYRAVQRFARLRDANILRFYDDNRTDLGGQVALTLDQIVLKY